MGRKSTAETATCRHCHRDQPVDEAHWYKRRAGGFYTDGRCKDCEHEYRKARRSGAPLPKPTIEFRVTQHVLNEASGSEIISESGGGYDLGLSRQLRENQGKRSGATLRLDEKGLRDLIEFMDAQATANRDEGNRRGASSLANHVGRAQEALAELAPNPRGRRPATAAERAAA